MSKVAAFSVLAAFFLTSVAQPTYATTSRVSSLGGSGDYFEDDSNVLRWFGSLGDYSNQVTLGSGHFNLSDGYWHEMGWKRSGPELGAHLALGQDGRFGTAALYYHGQDETSSSAIYQLHLQNNLSFLYSLDLGPLDAAIYYGHSDGTGEVADSSVEFPVNSFGFGLRMDLGQSAYIDVAGDAQFIDEDWSGDSSAKDHESNNCYNFRSRAFIALGPRMALVPLVEIIHEELQHAASPDKFHSNLQSRVGVGLNYFPDTDHLLLFNAEFVDGSREFFDPQITLTDDWTALILNIGFESRMLSWLTTRGSVGYVDYDLQTDSWGGTLIPYDDELEDPIMRINLGASVHLGPADLDFSFAERFPETGFLTRDLVESKHWLSITARYLF